MTVLYLHSPVGKKYCYFFSLINFEISAAKVRAENNVIISSVC